MTVMYVISRVSDGLFLDIGVPDGEELNGRFTAWPSRPACEKAMRAYFKCGHYQPGDLVVLTVDISVREPVGI